MMIVRDGEGADRFVTWLLMERSRLTRQICSKGGGELIAE